MTKAELRKLYLEKRLSLSDEEYDQLTTTLCKNFFDQIDLTGISVLHTFLPLEKNREPDTWLIIRQLRRQFPAVRISIPKINTLTNTIESFFYENSEQLSKNSWGIWEPQDGVKTELEEIELVVVPMLVCDLFGQRVGYGKGFYDRFLSACDPTCKRVGMCFFEPVDKIDDVTGFDIPLHSCVTPLKVYHF